MSAKLPYHFSCHCQSNVYTLTVPSLLTTAVAPSRPSATSDESSPTGDIAADPHGSSASARPEGSTVAAGVDGITVCDCTFCTKRLLVWARQPRERVEFRKGCIEGKGEGTVEVYRFGQENLANMWCGKCGTYLYGAKSSEPESIYVNLRALREPFFSIYDLPPARITQRSYADIGPVRKPPTLSDNVHALISEKQADMGEEGKELVVHVGSCHCRDVVFGYLGKKWGQEKVGACLCSICYGNGNIWTGDPDDHIFFSPASSTSPHRPRESLVTRYLLDPSAPSANHHVFCKRCGCQVIEIKEDNASSRRTLGVNVACFDEREVQVQLGDGGRGGKCGVLRVNAGPRDWEPVYRLEL